ncbi:MAG: ketoacyl-ACP synthase III [Candidatus Cloacimonetes bacterium]|jgi:3-oxoacyl-[acyl-carrier-protein] synthase-3|nr:ketoacyl-ACP synthase III [Candidatus Cloacimonadota bacterium]
MKSPKPIVEVVSTGRYLPDRVLTNADLETMVETTDEWIRERTGIRERRIASDDMGAAEMGARAARIAMERAGVLPGEIDIIVVSTATPDRLLPSTACDMQALLGATNAAAFDVSAACSGFLYALTVAEGYIAAGRGEIALVVSTEKMSGIVDWEDRSTCVLFGDGAGAAIVRRAQNGRGVLSSFMRSDGTLAELLWRPAGGVKVPMDVAVLEEKAHLVKMAGREVFKAAVRSMAEAADQALVRAGLTGEDIDLLIPHQANIRIIEATARYANVPMEKVFVNVDRYGNMSSATVPIALDEAVEQGRVKPGDNVLMVAFGAGFTWASGVIRW